MAHEVDRKLRRDTDLVSAAVWGQVEEIERLIAAGADVNALVDGWTPLQKAADNGHVAAIEALVKAGAHVDGANSSGRLSCMPPLPATLPRLRL